MELMNSLRKLCAALVVVTVASALLTTEGFAAPTQWQVQTVPPGGTLLAVSCPSTTFCVAVGYEYGSSSTVIDMWNGTSWSLVRTSAPGPVWLYGVSCSSATFCMAVGLAHVGTFAQTFTVSWDGTNWSVVPSLNRGTRDSILNSVSCVSGAHCVAVGLFVRLPHAHTLIETWNGTSWSLMAAPDESSRDDQLYGVSCADDTSCVAVGSSLVSGGGGRPLVEVLGAGVWTIVRTPRLPFYGYFGSVSCVSTAYCVAVGLRNDTGSTLTTLAEVWNGTTWTRTRSRNPAHQLDALSSVSCTSTTNCVAVGSYDAGPRSTRRTLIESWDGSSWSNTSPVPGQLTGISCIDDNTCYAVGQPYDLILAGT